MTAWPQILQDDVSGGGPFSIPGQWQLRWVFEYVADLWRSEDSPSCVFAMEETLLEAAHWRATSQQLGILH
eukprot:14155401-Ditylum_brightwellii.AAC.1